MNNEANRCIKSVLLLPRIMSRSTTAARNDQGVPLDGVVEQEPPAKTQTSRVTEGIAPKISQSMYRGSLNGERTCLHTRSPVRPPVAKKNVLEVWKKKICKPDATERTILGNIDGALTSTLCGRPISPSISPRNQENLKPRGEAIILGPAGL